jgi:ADP-heptose:LPS heptosyltransferase
VRGQSIQRLVVIFPGALGDLLLALPALRLLRARHHTARCTLALTSALRPLVAGTGLADESVALEDKAAAGLFGGDRLPPWLEERPVVYSWLGAGDDTMRARLARAACATTFLRVERGAGPVHAAVAYARALGFGEGMAALAAGARLAPPPSAAAERLAGRLPGPVLVAHPGAGARGKRWDGAGLVQVAQWWRSSGGSVVTVAGPAEAEDAPLLGAPEARDWPLPDVAALLARAALYLGNDSGISHLAGAVDAPGVVLFGPTDPRRWRPLGRRLVVLRARAWAPDVVPLRGLPPARVIAACRRRFALTRGGATTSVGRESLAGRLGRRFE